MSNGVGGIFFGGGEMGVLMRLIDWSRTPLGAPAEWPQSLRTAVSMLLESRFPMYIAWGREYVQLYNDGYRPILGSTKHPAAMGNRAAETFAESWHIIGPMFDDVRRGNATGSEDWMLPLDRNGYLEECYFTFSYSPIRDETSGVGGVLVTVTETTGRVLSARRLGALHELSERTLQAKSPEGACEAAALALKQARSDVPFALLYLLSQDGKVARLAASSGVRTVFAALRAELTAAADGEWPVRTVVESGRASVVSKLPFGEGDVSGGAWPESAREALVQPISRPGQAVPYGFIVTGVSPRRRLDKDYRDFFSLVAGHVATAVTNARAFEEERRRAQELAELDRAKTAFFSNVSHEFRTPLTLLLGPAEDALAATTSLSPQDAERWQVVHRNAQRLAKLVNALLDFASIEAGRVEATYVRTDLAATTAELASMFRSAIERAGLRLTLDLEPSGDDVYVDREMWEKIVLNLLSNALKFTFEGEIHVSQRCKADQVETVVRDTGIGIGPGELPRVFDRFHRVRGVRSRTQEGSGIGLALVQELARLHGGRVEVESALGKGTQFRVTLPVGTAHLPRERLGRSPKSVSASPLALPYVEEASRWLPGTSDSQAKPNLPGDRERILIADDNADMREYLARLLGDRWHVEVAADGATALEMARLRPPDLVVADVMMPRLDGFGLLRELRANHLTRSIPVVLLSARAGEEATAEGLSAGANDYLVKPFSARELLVRVAAQLGASAAARETQAATERERERLYTHFMQAPFPIGVLHGPKHVFELANPQALRVWGKDASILGKPLLVAMPELSGQPFVGYLDEVLRTGVPFEGKEALARLARGPNGAMEDVYFNFVYSPLRGPAGAVEGILLCGFEVTDQVVARREVEGALTESARLNEQLSLSEQLFRTLADHLPELAWSARPDGFIDFYNRRWFEYTGTTLEEMEGWGWQRVHDPAMLDAVIAQWERSLKTGELFEMEFPLRGADGIFRWFLTRVQPVRDGRGQILRWIGTNTDVHEQREARRRIDEFLAMLGHELRNPLAPILTAVKLMELRGDDRSKREREVIDRQVRHLSRLVDDLLDVSRIAQGKIDLGWQSVDVAEVAASAVETASPLFETKSHQVSIRVPPGKLFVKGDPVRLAQVISNLLTNAAKYTPARGHIELTAGQENDQIVIRVKDDGIGIARDFLPKVFDLFVQSRRALDRAEGGLGLGLTLVKNLVTLHGGQVTAHSDGADRGSEFVVRLPALEPRAQEPRGAGRAEQVDPIPSGKRVLIVDDNVDAAELLADALSVLGHQVAVAHDGPQALTLQATFCADVGVLDLGLPVMDGFELAARLRQASASPLRLIALTGYGQDSDRERTQNAGFDAHLVKPVEVDELGKLIG